MHGCLLFAVYIVNQSGLYSIDVISNLRSRFCDYLYSIMENIMRTNKTAASYKSSIINTSTEILNLHLIDFCFCLSYNEWIV